MSVGAEPCLRVAVALCELCQSPTEGGGDEAKIAVTQVAYELFHRPRNLYPGMPLSVCAVYALFVCHILNNISSMS